jgi:hypothetical protein
MEETYLKKIPATLEEKICCCVLLSFPFCFFFGVSVVAFVLCGVCNNEIALGFGINLSP